MKFLSNLLVKAGLVVEGVTDLYAAAAVVDTDKFVVLDGNTIKYRTGSQVLSDIGAEASIPAGTTAQYWRGDKSWQTLDTTAVPEGTNLYFTDARARAAISLTTTGTSGAATYVGGVLNIPQYQAVLTNPVTGTGSAGQVAYWTGTTTQTGSNNLFFNTATGSLGIGTTTTGLFAGTTRSLTLSANGSGEIASLEIQGNRIADQTAGILSFYNGSNRIAYITGTVGALTTSGVMVFFTHNAGTANEVMRLTTAGNLHVGTFVSDSGDKLQVSGAARIYSTGVGNSTVIKNNSSDASIFIGGSSLVGSTAARNVIVDTVGSYSALTGGRNYVFGRLGAALTSASDNVFIGSHGSQLTTGTRNVFIGAHNGDSFSFDPATSRVIFISTGVAGTEGTNKAIPTGNNWAFIGGYANSNSTNQFYFGAAPFINHPFAASLTDISFFAPSGVGTDFAGGDFIFNAGRGTGTGAPGDLIFRTSTATTTGTTLQTLSDRMVIAGGTGAVRLNAYGSGGRTGTPAYDLAVDSSGNVIEVAIGSGMVTGAGAAGQVTYWDSATNVTGSNNLFWDATNNRLGIGTNAPSQRLEVNGNGLIGTVLLSQNTPFITGSNVSSTSSIAVGSSAGFLGLYAGNSVITFNTNSNERMRIFAGGNVAIGSTSDNGLRFQVTGDGFFSGSVGIGTTAITDVNLYIRKNLSGSVFPSGLYIDSTVQSTSTTGAAYISTSVSTQASTFTLPNLYHFRATQSTIGAGSTVTNQYGYIAEASLIGATNNFGFYGNIASGTGRWNLYMNGTANNFTAGDFYVGQPVLRTSDASIRKFILNGSQIGIGAEIVLTNETANDAASNAISFVGIRGDYGISGQIRTTRRGIMTFHTQDLQSLVSPPERMRLDANGYLGIGTTPTVILDVAGASNLTSRARFAKTGTTKVLQFGADRDTSLLPYIGSESNHGFSIITNNTEVARFDTSGNLGLGVTPSAWNSKSRSFELSQTNRAGLVLEHFRSSDATAGNAVNVGVGFYRGTADDTLRYINSFTKPQIFGCFDGAFSWYQAPAGTAGNTITLTEAMKLDASGNLAVGTTTTTNRLEVWGSGNTAARIVGQSAGNATLILSSGGVTAYSIKSGNGDSSLRIDQDGTDRVTLASGGNLAIGTTNTDIFSRGDARNVVISATGASDNMSLQLNGGASGGRGAQIYMGTGGVRYFTIGTNVNETQIGTVTSTPIIFYTNNGEKMRLFADGNVGIGTGSTNAGFRLDVNGTMRVSGASTFNGTGASISMTTAGDTALWSQVTNAGGILYVGRDNAAGGSFGVANGHVIYGTGARPMAFFTNATERMRLDSSGNLAIGATSASYRLDVVGSGIRTAPTPGSSGLWGSYVLGSSLDSLSQYFDAFRITGSGSSGYANINNNVLFQVWNGSAWGTQVAINQGNGAVGIGTTSLTGRSLSVSKNITGQYIFSGGSYGVGVLVDGVIQSDEVGGAAYFRSFAQTQAASFTAGAVYHFEAVQGTFGAGSTVSNQVGFFARETLIGATNNFGFYGNIASGTGRWNLYMNGTANNYMAGSLGIGSTSLAGVNLSIGKSITGATTSYGVYQNGQIQSDVTGSASYFHTDATTQATAFTLGNLRHYFATQGTIGAGSSITNQFGYVVASSLIGATNNYGFYGDIAAGTGRWNLYMNGTAANYLNGNLSLGTTNSFARIHTFGHILAVNGTGAGSGSQLYLGSLDFNNSSFWNSAPGIGAVHSTTSGVASDLGFYTYAGNANSRTERARIFYTGNIGIGTTTDAGFLLDVNGTMRVSGASTLSSSVSIGGLTYIDGAATALRTNNTVSYTSLESRLSGTRSWQIDNVSNAFQLYMQGAAAYVFNIASTGAATFSSTVTASSNITSTDGTSSTVIQTISNAPRLVLIDGRVGGKRFDIGPHPVTSSGNFVIRDATATVNRFTIESTGDITFSNNSTALAFIPSGATVPTNGMYLPAANTLGFSTNTTEDMRLTSSGNLLIATTTDTGEKLQVNGDAKITGDLLLSGTVTTATNGDYSANFSKSYAQASVISNTNLYGLVSNAVFDLTNGSYSGSATYNATSLLAQASVAGNTGTQSTQPIRSIMAGLVGKASSAAMNLADFRFIDVKAPDNGGVSGHVIGDIYGLRIAALKGATNYTITNGWGVYQEGTTDNNYFGGKVLVGTATAGSSPVRISGLPTSATGLSAGDLWNDSGTIKIA